MKVAAVSLTRNDDFRLPFWMDYYDEYKDEIYEHIVVDNGSNAEYLSLLKKAFPNSTIIELGYNGGCTGAYNAGIRHALQNPDIDAILLIGNDVKIERGGITKLYKLLYSDEKIGMVGPVVLKKDSDIIDWFGFHLNYKNGISKGLYSKRRIVDVGEQTIEVSYVAGGANMSRREFYEEEGVGLQDENLFMYGDERDMAIRASLKGYKEVATSEVKSWHQHIDKIGNHRDPRTSYLVARNHIYIGKKYFSKYVQYKELSYCLLIQIILFIRDIVAKERRKHFYYYLKGVWAGLKNNMDNTIMQ